MLISGEGGLPGETCCAVGVGGPEASIGALAGVGGEDRGARGCPDLVDILHDGQRLADGFPVMDEHRDLLVHRVGHEEELQAT